MAAFCRDCTKELFGAQYEDRNDMVRSDLKDDEMAADLCEHCGYGFFDKNGKRVEQNG